MYGDGDADSCAQTGAAQTSAAVVASRTFTHSSRSERAGTGANDMCPKTRLSSAARKARRTRDVARTTPRAPRGLREGARDTATPGARAATRPRGVTSGSTSPRTLAPGPNGAGPDPETREASSPAQ